MKACIRRHLWVAAGHKGKSVFAPKAVVRLSVQRSSPRLCVNTKGKLLCFEHGSYHVKWTAMLGSFRGEVND